MIRLRTAFAPTQPIRDAMKPEVSLIVPHYQTPELTLLCLRLVRMKTEGVRYETIVIDNGSGDGSGERLAEIEWIRLLRRDCAGDGRPARSHGLALNLGLQRARSDLVVVMHSDTMVLRPDWLSFLLEQRSATTPAASIVGSWKMEPVGRFNRLGKWCEDRLRALRGRSRRRPRYVRSHCALYDRGLRDRYPRMFDPSPDRSAGEELFEAAAGEGAAVRFLPPDQLGRYVFHLNHATMALNAEFGATDRYMPRTRSRAVGRIRAFFDRIDAPAILADRSVDAA